MTAKLAHGGTIWVCVDCLVADVNGEEPIDRPATEPQVWALWEDDTDHELTVGMLHEDHECDKDDAGRPLDDECGCSRHEFSWSACDGCGSTLGGSREAYTYWTR